MKLIFVKYQTVIHIEHNNHVPRFGELLLINNKFYNCAEICTDYAAKTVHIQVTETVPRDWVEYPKYAGKQTNYC